MNLKHILLIIQLGTFAVVKLVQQISMLLGCIVVAELATQVSRLGELILLKGCDSRYYQRPRCIDYSFGYRCQCPPGYFWNTQACVGLLAFPFVFLHLS